VYSPDHIRPLLRARWLSIASLISVGALSLAAGATGAVAAARPSAPAARDISFEAMPHSVTQRSQAQIQHPNITSSAPTCNDQFNVVSSQNAGTSSNNELKSVSAISGTDAWAVGDYDAGTTTVLLKPEAQHWDGTAWTLPAAQPPAVGSGNNRLRSVTAVATNNVWAVGFSKADNNPGTLRNVLIEQYNGTAWTAVPDTTTNNPAGMSNLLFGVKFFSATDIWAVGSSKNSTGTTSAALIEHYNGTSWSTQAAAAVTGNSVLIDVLPLAANNVYAVGGQAATSTSPGQTLVEHYDGTSWTVVSAQNPNPNGQFFEDIAGVSNDLWAVGGQTVTSTTDASLIEHFDGTNWTVVSSPTPDLGADLIGVRYAAANDVWAVGASAYQNAGTTNELDHSLIEHWDGNSWTQVQSPNPNNHAELFDVALAGSNLLLTVGFSQDAVAGAASTTLAAALCEPTPTVSGLNPDHGNSAGGTVVKITGTGLHYPRAVKFGTAAAMSFGANSDTQITAVAPAGTAGSVVDVTVTTMGGTSATSAADQYTNFGPGAWDNAGGVLASGPAASTWGSGRLDAFVSGTDGILYHRFWNGTSWAWEGLPGVTPGSDASSVSTGVGLIDVFVRGSDGALWHRHFTNAPTPAWSAWESLGGLITGAPAAVSVGGGNIDVFVQGTDNHLWYDSLVGTAWSWHLAGGVLGAPPAAVSAAVSTADAFVMGTDSALWRWSSTGTWTSYGGKLSGKPAATNRGTTLDVFVEGTDIGLWHWTNAGATSTWEGLGGKLAAAPAAVSWGTGRLDVFVEGTDSALYHAWSTSTGAGAPWSWEGVGGKLMGSPMAVTWGINRLDAFVRGADNHLWHLVFN
jgi:hypothetical protein